MSNNEEKLPNRASPFSPHDLKSQFSEFKQSLGKRKSSSPLPPLLQGSTTSNAGAEPSIHLPPMPGSSLSNIGDELRITSRVCKQRMSMPIIPHNAASGAQTQKNDVNFLTDLSDGLLGESRRLQYENKHLKAKLKELDGSSDAFQKQINNLNVINKKLSDKEQEYDDRIWDLETENGSLKDILTKTQADFSKVLAEKMDKQSLVDELKSQVETLKIQKTEFETESFAKLNKLKESLDEMKARNSDLNDENDQLHQKVQTLNIEVDTLQSGQLQQSETIKDIAALNEAANDTFDFEDSMLLKPSDQEIKALQDSDKVLEAETLKSNLDHAYSTITKLRHALGKSRRQVEELASAQEFGAPPPVGSSAGPHSPSPHKLFKRKKMTLDTSFGISPSKRQSKTLSYIDTTDSSITGDADWENFEGIGDVSAMSGISGVELNKSRSLTKTTGLSMSALIKSDDDEYMSAREFGSTADLGFNGSVSGSRNNLSIVDSALSGPASSYNISKPLKSPASIPHLLSDELQDIEPLNDRDLTLEEVELFAKNNNYRLISQEEYEDLKAVPPTTPTPSQLHHIKSTTTPTASRGIDTISSPTMSDKDSFIQAASLGVIAMPNSSQHTLATLEQLNAKCAEFNMIPIKDEEYNRLVKFANYEEIDEEELQSKLGNFNLTLLPTPELNDLQADLKKKDDEIVVLTDQFKDIEVLKMRVGDFGYIGVPEEEYYDLTSKNADLEKTLAARDEEHNELKDKFSGKTKELAVLADSLFKRDSDLESRKKELTQLNESAAGQDKKLTERQQKIEELNVVVSEKEKQVVQLNEVIAAKDVKISTLQDNLDEKTEQLKFTSDELAVVEKQLGEVKKQVDEPDLDFVTKSVALLGLTALPIKEHEKNVKSLNDTTRELTSVQAKLEQPDAEYIQSKAASLDLVALPVAEHKKLVSNLHEVEHDLTLKTDELAEKAREVEATKKLVAAKEQELTELQADLMTKDTAIKQLQAIVDEPDEEFVSKNAEARGLFVLPKTDYDSIVAEAEIHKHDLQKQRGLVEDHSSKLEKLKRELNEKQTALDDPRVLCLAC
ncbi:unnamed protein product [Ambrosiozyma monospora]|uniref:Unnamed protein product n=1 Tax=Ambrosiozyma monospora TaxID=43982 RepID=A0A9W6YNN2_AMBMO|nr:unnamed protein product [Ambrosiozyma monospora]